MENKVVEAYERAEKRVKKIKAFYEHLTAYFLISAFLMVEGLWGVELLGMSVTDADPEFFQWLFWNVLSVPALWGVGVLIHGIVVWVPELRAYRNWEARMLARALERERGSEYH